MVRKIIIMMLLLFFSCSLSWAETVYLKSGKKITGKIVSQDEQQIKMDISGIMVTYFTDEIDRVEGASAPTPPPATTSTTPPAPEQPSDSQVPSLLGGQKMSAAKKEMILSLISVSGTRESMDSMFTQIMSEAPPEESAKLKEIFNLDEIIDRFIPVYDKYFTEDDLGQLINFYKSPIGKKLIKVTPLLMEDSMTVSMEYFKEKMPAESPSKEGAVPGGNTGAKTAP